MNLGSHLLIMPLTPVGSRSLFNGNLLLEFFSVQYISVLYRPTVKRDRRQFLMKSVFQKFQSQFGEGTAFDLDYGKLIILGLLIYLAFFKDYGG